MTEKEKMLRGELYESWDAELVEDRRRAKKLCKRFNEADFEEKKEREEILAELFGTDKRPHIEPSFWCDYGYNIEFGEGFYANHNLTILDVNKVVFGNDVLCGPNVQIYTAGHPLDAETRNTGLEFGKAISIGNNVWIGGGSIILPNVTIGDNVVIGAGSVVTKDIESDVIVVGNPARVVRKVNQ